MAEEQKICAQCGHAQMSGAFCEICGAKLPDATAVPTPPPVAQPQPAAAQVAGMAQAAAAPQAIPQPQYAPQMPPMAPGVYPGYPPPPSQFTEYLTFRRMLTPVLAQVIFWVFEGMNLFYWIKSIYYARHLGVEVAFSVFALLFTAVFIRVIMEVVMKVFKKD